MVITVRSILISLSIALAAIVPALGGKGAGSEKIQETKQLWKDARLVASPETLEGQLKLTRRNGYDLKTQLQSAQQGRLDDQDIGGLLGFTNWLLNQIVCGPHVEARLQGVVAGKFSQLDGLSVEEKDKRLRALAKHLSGLPLSNSKKGEVLTLGDMLPEEYIFNTGSEENRFQLTNAPREILQRISPSQEIQLLHGEPKGCTPCREDPTSSLGGRQVLHFARFHGSSGVRMAAPKS